MATPSQRANRRGHQANPVKPPPPRPYFLPRNEGTRIPQSLVFVDTEATITRRPKSTLETHTLRLGVAIGLRREGGQWCRRSVLRFTQAAQFWEWLSARERRKQPIWVFAHNAGYDATLLDLWGQMDRGEYTLADAFADDDDLSEADQKKGRPWYGCAVVADPPTILAMRSVRGTVRWIDTLNYWRIPLAELGQSVGLEKLEMPLGRDSDAKWFDYCERDTEIIERAVTGLMDTWHRADSGCWQTTAAGLAWAAFRHTMESRSIVVDHSEPHTGLSRAAYYGGQAEAFYVGKGWSRWPNVALPGPTLPDGQPAAPVGPFTMLDVRSLYPTMMRDNPFPVKFKHISRDRSIATFEALSRSFLPLGQCRVRSAEYGYPVRWKGRLYHVIGDFWTVLAGPEMLLAHQRGELVELGEVAWYHAGFPFEGFVNYWYNRRTIAQAAGNRADAELAKLVLNSLSGKFAQHKIRWQERPEITSSERWGEWCSFDCQTRKLVKWRGIANHAQELGTEGEGKHACCAISAFITAYGRVHMARLRSLLPERSCLYQDTDSLIVTSAGLAALAGAGEVAGDCLGSLRTVWEADYLAIHGPKDYATGRGHKIAGVSPNAPEVRPGVFQDERWQRLPDTIARTPAAAVKVSTVELTMKRDTLNRIVQPDGWTIPFTWEHLEDAPF